MAILAGHQPPTPLLLKDFALLSLLLLLLYIYSFLSCQTLHNVSKTKSRQLIGLGNKKRIRIEGWSVWGREILFCEILNQIEQNSKRRKERAHTHTHQQNTEGWLIETLCLLLFSSFYLLLFLFALSSSSSSSSSTSPPLTHLNWY